MHNFRERRERFAGQAPIKERIMRFSYWKEKIGDERLSRVKENLEPGIKSGTKASEETMELAGMLPNKQKGRLNHWLNILETQLFGEYSSQMKKMNPGFDIWLDEKKKLDCNAEECLAEETLSASHELSRYYGRIFNNSYDVSMDIVKGTQVEYMPHADRLSFLSRIVHFAGYCINNPTLAKEKGLPFVPEKMRLEALKEDCMEFIENPKKNATNEVPAELANAISQLGKAEMEELKNHLNLKIAGSFGLFLNELCTLGMEISSTPCTMYSLKNSEIGRQYSTGWITERKMGEIAHVLGSEKGALIKNEAVAAEGFEILIGDGSKIENAGRIRERAREWEPVLNRFLMIVMEVARAEGKKTIAVHFEASWFEKNYGEARARIQLWGSRHRRSPD